jgi:hypothetical protein
MSYVYIGMVGDVLRNFENVTRQIYYFENIKSKNKRAHKMCPKKCQKRDPRGSQNRTFVDIVFAITVSIFRGHFAAIRSKDFLADLYWLLGRLFVVLKVCLT